MFFDKKRLHLAVQHPKLNQKKGINKMEHKKEKNIQ